MSSNKKRSIVVIGGGLKKVGSRWKTIDLGEGGDDFAASNDRWRVEAAASFWQKNPDYFILALGGKGQLTPIPGAPTVAEVIKNELKDLGVPDRVILKEEKSGNTLEQLSELKRIIKEENFKEVLIISNEWHIPRIKAIFEFYPGLKEDFNAEVQFLSAEDILLNNNPTNWQKRIEEARENPQIMERVRLEKQGVEQIKNGTYKFSNFIKNDE